MTETVDSIRTVDQHGHIHWKTADGYDHRTDGPAILYTDGEEEWHYMGDIHRVDGPAVVYPTGKVEWWWYSKSMSFEQYIIKANWTDEQIIEYKLTGAIHDYYTK